MNELISTFTDPKTWIIVYFVVAFISGTGIIYLWVLSAKYWRKTKDSLYAKAIIEIARLRDLLSKKSIRCLYQSIHIELLKCELKTAEQSTKRKSLRKEIARLKLLNSGLETTISNVNSQRLKTLDLFNKTKAEDNDRIKRLTETIEHRKHQSKQIEVDSEPETGWWSPIDNHYKQFFPKEGVFMESVYKVSGGRFMYLKADDSGRAFLVQKKYFSPVKAEG